MPICKIQWVKTSKLRAIVERLESCNAVCLDKQREADSKRQKESYQVREKPRGP